MFQQPTSFFKMLLDKIQPNSLATIHRIFHCFLEMQKSTVAVFSNDHSSATSRLKRPLEDSSGCKECSVTAGKSAPKKRKLKPTRSLSQLVSLQVVQLHVTEVDVVLHGKLQSRSHCQAVRGHRGATGGVACGFSRLPSPGSSRMPRRSPHDKTSFCPIRAYYAGV